MNKVCRSVDNVSNSLLRLHYMKLHFWGSTEMRLWNHDYDNDRINSYRMSCQRPREALQGVLN